MNRFLKIFVGIAAVVALASCNQKVEYQTSSFVCFENSAYTFNEDAGTVEIPVFAYAKNADLSFPREGATTSVTFQVVDNTAKNGTNFAVEPANGVVAFSNASKAVIKINIEDLAGVFTGDLDFSIVISSASNDFTVGGLNTINVKIKDLDHPLADMFGTYATTGIDYWSEPYSFEITLGPVDGSPSSVAFHNLCPGAGSYIGAHSAIGTVNAEKTEVTLTTGQLLGVYGGSYNFYFDTTDAAEIVFTFDKAAGTLTSKGMYGSMSPEAGGYFEIYPSPTFKKK